MDNMNDIALGPSRCVCISSCLECGTLVATEDEQDDDNEDGAGCPRYDAYYLYRDKALA